MSQPATTSSMRSIVRNGALLLAVGVAIYAIVKLAVPYDYPMLGQAAPKISLASLEGAPLPVGDELGSKVVVLNFWATWCPPCREELPEFSKLATQFPGQPVAFYSVATDQEKDLIASVVNETTPKPPVAYDAGMAAAEAFQVRMLPTTVVIDKKGTIRHAHIGFTSDTIEAMRNEINALMAE